MKLSVLDLSIVPPNGNRHQAITNTLELCQKADELGYHRYWVAEHHGAGTGAGRTPEAMIPYLASQTKNIRVGSGAVLLNHYSPYKEAEVFNSLEETFPHRIDMGIGRATGGPIIDFALQQNRENYSPSANNSEAQLRELIHWMNHDFPAEHPFSQIQSYNDGTLPQFWLLGSSPFSSNTAAELSLRYSFAAFINPSSAYQISQNYLQKFQIGQEKGVQIGKPHLMLALNVFIADTMEKAAKMTAPFYIFQKQLQTKGDIHSILPTEEEAMVELGGIPSIEEVSDYKNLPKVIAGTPDKVYPILEKICKVYGAQEIMMQTITGDHQARMRQLELLAEVASHNNA